MNKEYKPITNLWKDSEGYRYFGTLKLSSKIKYDGDDFIPLWEWINQLQKENKILKENAENNDKVVDKVNWENMLLKKENKQLKENYERIYNENCKLREEHNITDISLLDENYKIKDNWNKLRDYVLKKQAILFDTEYTCYSNVLDKMQEIEQGSDSNVKN